MTYLGMDNVIYVDDVDAPTGGRVVRTSRMPLQMPRSAGQIGCRLGCRPTRATPTSGCV
jgi:hypothetical protein